MSRLDSFIRRLNAQRACLDLAAEMVGDRPGPILELGLGNGRTYDHLRDRLPGREIFVFDRQVAAHPECLPDERHLVLGDLTATLPGAATRIGGRPVLAHCDLGSGDVERDARLAAFVGPALDRLMAPGGIVVSDQAFEVAGWEPLAVPAGVATGRYFMWRVPGR